MDALEQGNTGSPRMSQAIRPHPTSGLEMDHKKPKLTESPKAGTEKEDSDQSNWRCNICYKVLSRKQRLESHCSSVHQTTECIEHQKYKRYEVDPSVAIPERTLRRHHMNKRLTLTTEKGTEELEDQVVNNKPPVHVEHSLEMSGDDYPDPTGGISPFTQNHSCGDDNVDLGEEFNLETNLCMSKTQDDVQTEEECVYESSGTSSNCSLTSEHVQTEDECVYESSGTSSNCSVTSELSDRVDGSENCETEGNISGSSTEPSDTKSPSPECIAVMSYILRHTVNNAAATDMYRLFHVLRESGKTDFKTSEVSQALGDIPVEHFDVCTDCGSMFPEDKSVYECATANCSGLRFKGSLHEQHQRMPKCSFATLSIEQQLKELLTRSDIQQALADNKKESRSGTISDISSGVGYRTALSDLGPVEADVLTLCFNTDGALLYKSSHVNLWPIFLVVNELPPKMRFSRKNMLIWGLWQGEGKPVFNSLFLPFVKDMNTLRNTGFCVTVGEKSNHYRAILLLGTADLQAKAPLLGMAYHNGAFGCITCEESGEVVKSGKGHSRYYPKRDRPVPLRTSEGMYQTAVEASRTGHPEKGIKSLSPLFGMPWFDVVHGTVPDYMHGVLLGVVKKLNQLWFSTKHKKKPYSILKHIKVVDDRLTSMKPIDMISRLPRSLSKNLAHWKASEYETWLLHYGVPCLQDVLPYVYLNHFALLVSSIHILLREQISEEDLTKAQESLSSFYGQFADLYGPENCGLNVHNVGEHLVFYVSLWGPMWAWSCFAFEDMNGFVLDNVHGSGNVSVQALKMIQRHKIVCVEKEKLKNETIQGFVTDMLTPSRLPKKLKRLKIGFAAGRFHETVIDSESLLQDISSKSECQPSKNDFCKIFRVVYNNQVYFSAEYTKVKKRNSHVVLVNDSAETERLVAVDIQYFLCNKSNLQCFAIVKPLIEDPLNTPFTVQIQHQKRIRLQLPDCIKVYPISNIKEKVMFLDGNVENVYISQIPNFHRLST